jgi:hypothetical protein
MTTLNGDDLSPHFRDMLNALSDANVEFMIVGAYAMAAHGFPRATGDIDLWVRRSSENAQRIWKALLQFGAPLAQVTPDDFAAENIVYQIGLPPNRIDLLTSIDGIDFAAALGDCQSIMIDGRRISVIGKASLIQNKRASGRPKDLLDAKRLEQSKDV